MTYRIETDMATGRHTNALFWTGSEVVGILRANEAATFATRQEADAALAAIKPNLVRFYDLAVVDAKNTSRLPSVGNNGWMVRHPGFYLG